MRILHIICINQRCCNAFALKIVLSVWHGNWLEGWTPSIFKEKNEDFIILGEVTIIATGHMSMFFCMFAYLIIFIFLCNFFYSYVEQPLNSKINCLTKRPRLENCPHQTVSECCQSWRNWSLHPHFGGWGLYHSLLYVLCLQHDIQIANINMDGDKPLPVTLPCAWTASMFKMLKEDILTEETDSAYWSCTCPWTSFKVEMKYEIIWSSLLDFYLRQDMAPNSNFILI